MNGLTGHNFASYVDGWSLFILNIILYFSFFFFFIIFTKNGFIFILFMYFFSCNLPFLKLLRDDKYYW